MLRGLPTALAMICLHDGTLGHYLNRLRTAWMVWGVLTLLIVPQRELSAQPRYWAPQSPPAAHYQFTVKIGLGGIEGTGTIRLTNSTRRALTVLALDRMQSFSQLPEVRVADQSLRLLNPPSPASASGSGPLLYALPQPLGPQGQVELTISFQAKQRVRASRPTVELRYWQPRLWWDGLPVCERFEVRLETPPGYAVAASGRFNPTSGAYENDGVKDFGIWLGKDLEVEEREVDGVLIRALFTKKGAACGHLCLETAADVIRFYREWLGFYPYRFLTLIPGMDTPQGGYPFAAGVVAIHGQEQFDTRPLSWWQWITAHEIGHQYWGEHVMDADNPAWTWIGLGIYADHRYGRARGILEPGYSRFITDYLKGARRGVNTGLDLPPEALANISENTYNNVTIHGKGFAVVSALESCLGRETFERTYRRCLREYGHRRMGYHDLWRIAEEESGENLHWFFDAWVRGSQAPQWQVTQQESRPSETNASLYQTRITVESRSSFRLPVTVKAIFADGSSQVQVADRVLPVNVLEFQSPSALNDVVLDPDQNLAILREPLVAHRIEELPWTGAGEGAMNVFAQAKRDGFPSEARWFKLAMVLMEGGHQAEALECFARAAKPSQSSSDQWIANVWQGHLLDLQGQRDQALRFYQAALDDPVWQQNPGYSMRHDQFKLRIDRAWIQQRLRQPFAWPSQAKSNPL